MRTANRVAIPRLRFRHDQTGLFITELATFHMLGKLAVLIGRFIICKIKSAISLMILESI